MNTPTRHNAILLIGPTGAGKTPVGLTAETAGLQGTPCRHFDFGAQLRAIHLHTNANMTPQARHIIQEVLAQGRLLEPHENFVASEILQCWLADIPPNAVIILNGLPRTIAQAIELEARVTVRLVAQLSAPDATILARIAQNSGGDRTGRADDHPDAVKKRLGAYHQRTAPLVDHYREQGVTVLTFPINENTKPHTIWQQICNTPWNDMPSPRQNTRTPHFLSVSQAARILRNGGVVAVPTETVYGLAANACNLLAVERIFAIKQRPPNDPLIVHIHDLDQLASLTTDWHQTAAQLARTFWPGPLTIILPKTDTVPDIVTAQLPTVAIRMPAHPAMREILQQCQCPLAAPSANRFGCISPTTAQHVANSLGHAPDGIVDGGPCEVGLESTIVAFGTNELLVLRPGAITAAALARATGLPVTPYQPKHQADIPAPGTMPRHYAPRTPLAIIGTTAAQKCTQGKKMAHLCFGPTAPQPDTYHTEINLSPTGNLTEAANRLYDALRHLDQLELDAILVDPIPQTGIGTAINDRIKRASQSS